jgi:hypothetical protein
LTGRHPDDKMLLEILRYTPADLKRIANRLGLERLAKIDRENTQSDLDSQSRTWENQDLVSIVQRS